MYQDKQLICADCGAQFVFTAGEQEFHASKGFTSEPRRCPACRAKRKSANAGQTGATEIPARPARTMYDAVCAGCGKPTQVPFQPTGARPVYCSECYHAKGGASAPRGEGFARPAGQRSFSGNSSRPTGNRNFGNDRPAGNRVSSPRESSFDSYDFGGFGDFGGDPFGGSGKGGSRKRNNKRDNKERSRKEGGGRPRNRFYDDDDEDDMY